MNALEILGGLTSILLIASVGLVVNSLVLWVVLKMLGYDGNGRLPKCILCCFLMTVVSFLSLFVLFFPLPYINVIIWLVTWYKLNKMVVDAIFENSNGTTILVVYLIVSFGVSFAMKAMDITA